MEFLNDVWGVKENMSPLELSARALVMFVIALIIVRVSGMRPFNKDNAFDTVIAFLIGGILSRGVVGATPFFSTVAGTIVIIGANKLISRLSFYNKNFEVAFKGDRWLLYKNGKFFQENMKKSDVTEKEIYETLRTKFREDNLDTIKEIFMEKNGEIGFIKKD